MRLQTIVSRELAPTEAAVVTVGSLQAGTKENVIPDEAIIKLNVRTFDGGVRKRVLAAIKRAGVKHRLDLFGVLVLSFVAGNSGGIARDLLIAAVPPPAISDWRYVAVSLLAGVVTFFCYGAVDRLRSPVLLFDAAGLAFFAASGAQKAVALGLGPVPAALLGMLTGIGGGMARDVLLTEVPTVLRADLYAVAALAAAAVVVIADMLQLPLTAATVAGAALCFGIRFLAIRRGWRLPVACQPGHPAAGTDAAGERRDVSGKGL